MKAMILAAGLGTRLRPLTDNRPKALVEVAGRTLLEITLSRLRGFGVDEVIVNVHHFGDMVQEYLKANQNFGMRIEISREDVLLDTGGGLKKAAWFFREGSRHANEPFILHNVDILSTIDLQRMLRFHGEHRALATLAVQDRETSRYLLFNSELGLCGRRFGPDKQAPDKNQNNESNEDKRVELVRPSPQLQALAFSGVHVISSRLLDMLTEEGAFSIITSYLRLAAQGERILGFRADEYYWRDLGTQENLRQASEDLKQKVFLQ